MPNRPALIAACCLALTAAAAPAAPPLLPRDDVLPQAVRAALARAGVAPESLGAVALPLDHRARPWAYRATAVMQPASTIKILTSIVALDRLGPAHRGSTELRSAAPLAGGTLHGDLVLKGGADPDFGVPQLWALLLDLRSAGVQTITGDLVVDRSLFDPPRPDLGQPPFDEAPEAYYNVIPDAVNLAGALLPLELQSDARTLRATTLPPLPLLDIDTSAMQVNPARTCREWGADWKPPLVSRDAGRITIRLQGAWPANCTHRPPLQLIDRLELEQRLFAALWHELGGRWAGRAREGTAPPDARVLARRVARPWGEVLLGMNKHSDNVQTRLLYLLLGAPGPDTRAAAERQVRDWLAANRIADAGLVIDNGSGLSRSERMSPMQLAQVLKVAAAGPHGPDLAASLPTAGVDGTMRNRLRGSPAAGWARLKTGALRNVVALAGYVNDAQGRPWAVAMMINDERALAARPALDALVDHIARVGLAPRRTVGPQGEGP